VNRRQFASPPQPRQRLGIVLTEAEIRGRIAELSQEISRDYAGRNPLLIGVLKGVIFFMSDLLLGITIPVTVDFMAISRYDPARKTNTLAVIDFVLSHMLRLFHPFLPFMLVFPDELLLLNVLVTLFVQFDYSDTSL